MAGSQAAAAPGTPPLLQKEALPVYPQQGGGAGQSLRQENGTYGVTKHLSHTEEGPGRVRRVTAAVVVNDRSVTEGAGKMEHAVWKPRSADEMHRLEELAQAAVGFDAKRGDQVVMENVSFSTNAPEVKPPVMDKLMEEARALLHSQPGLMRTVMIGLCGVLLVLFVLRPVAQAGDGDVAGAGVVGGRARILMAALEEPAGELMLEPEVEKFALPVRVKIEGADGAAGNL